MTVICRRQWKTKTNLRLRPLLFWKVWERTTNVNKSGRVAKIEDLLKKTGAAIVLKTPSHPGKRALANAEMMQKVWQGVPNKSIAIPSCSNIHLSWEWRGYRVIVWLPCFIHMYSPQCYSVLFRGRVTRLRSGSPSVSCFVSVRWKEPCPSHSLPLDSAVP